MCILVSVDTALTTEQRWVQEECYCTLRKSCNMECKCYLPERSRTECGLSLIRQLLDRKETCMFVGFFYIPPLTSSNVVQVGLQWQTLEFEVQRYKNMGDVVVMGDLNARVGLLNDHIVQDTIPNNVPCSLYCVNGVLPRISQDNSVNMHARQLVDICVNTGLQIVNGQVGADRGIGSFTCFTYNGSSVVDYVLAEEGIRERIVSFEVGDLQIHSDHCPLLLKLDIGTSYNNRCEETRISSEVLLEEKLSRKEAECQINKEIGEAFWAGSWLKEHEEEFQRRLSEAGWQDGTVMIWI